MVSCCSFTMVEGLIGVNWGRQTSHRLIPSMVVDLSLQNNIRNLKLFSPSDNVLRAFAGETLFLHVGSEPFSSFSRNITYDNAVEALGLIQEALVANGYENVTATTPHFTDVPNITKPSEADFRPDLKEKMVEFVRLLNTTNAPFVMNMFPIHFVAQNNWDIEYSFVENKSNFTIEDNGLIYRNVFEFVYDSFLTAMAKAGSPNLKLLVGQIGWPTDGYPGANTSNAERFFKEFLPYAKGNNGTPIRPGISIDVFIHSLADENLNKINLGAFQRHWGVYRSSGEPKYKIDFTGQGRDIYPTTAKGVILMPKRWCVFNGDTGNLTKVKQQFDFACQEADCTTLSPGGSCSHLDFNQNISYAFNRYFQANAQSNDKGITCDFEGLGTVVPDDPSVGICKFPIEILAAELADSDGLTNKIGDRLRGFSSASAMLLPLLLVFLLELV
ncbi:hypothetical protein Pfo_018650 [Paulownia fortunei]|nr:hypothetical protein Pfo_018650 [Paulownia fortunei]